MDRLDLESYLRRIECAIDASYRAHPEGAPGGPLSDFFRKVRQLELSEVEKLVRKVVSMHHPAEPTHPWHMDGYEYKEEMTLKEVDALGEGMLAHLVRDPDGREFYRIQLGLGDNPSDYYFPLGSEEPVVRVHDTDAILRPIRQPDGGYRFIFFDGTEEE